MILILLLVNPLHALIFIILSLLLPLVAGCGKAKKPDTGGTPGQYAQNAGTPAATEPVIDDLSDWDGPVVRAAFATLSVEDLNEKQKEFEESGEVRVQRMDYSVLNSDFDPHAGEERLILDLVTGKIAPDLVLLPSATGPAATAILEKKLYADLSPAVALVRFAAAALETGFLKTSR